MPRNGAYAWVWQGGYDKIPHLEDVSELLQLPRVVVTEKIHGLCWLIGASFPCHGASALVFADRWQVHTVGTPLSHVVAWFQSQERWLTAIASMAVELEKTLVISGEVYGSGIYGKAAINSYGTSIPFLDYGCTIGFCVHDIRVGGRLLAWAQVESLARKMDLPVVPLFYKGKPDLPRFEQLLGKTKMVRNGERGEGLIIRSDPPVPETDPPVLIAKMKVGEYAEVNSRLSAPNPVPATASPARSLALEYVTELRVTKAIHRLIACGEYSGTREDLFGLCEIIEADVQLEGKDLWQTTMNAYSGDTAAISTEIRARVKYWFEHVLRLQLLQTI